MFSIVKVLSLIIQLLQLRKDLMNPNVEVRNFAFDPLDLSLHVDKKNTLFKSSFLKDSTGKPYGSNRKVKS